MLPLHRSACGTGRHRSHGFGIPGTDLTPVAFNLPAGHRFSTGAELMLLKQEQLKKLEWNCHYEILLYVQVTRCMSALI